ncbi:hypothetical protein AVEN_101083-1 [Araneus ventricosus]|uniref:Uncharacterized protein n=1 Tax=Araneus ventricosus TaxID=182803 RepID=A0A4Y2E7Q2_ARAVE|nr:hypothetical protein AVEN_101083-1 [Araneus ventricosus]
MGGIKFIWPSRTLPPADSIKRLKSVPNAEDVGKRDILELLTSESTKTNALHQITVQDLNMLNPIPSKIPSQIPSYYGGLLNAYPHIQTFLKCQDYRMEEFHAIGLRINIYR